MLQLLLPIAPVLPTALLAAALTTATEGLRKCGTPLPSGKPIVAIDGEIVTVSPDSVMTRLVKDDILSIQIVCMNPQDSTFNRTRGIGAVSIWTKNGPLPQLFPVLNAIVAAQDAHVRREGGYIGDVARLPLPYRSPALDVKLALSENGWSATATVQRAFFTCHVLDGDAQPPAHGLKLREPLCFDDRGVVYRTLHPPDLH